MSCSVSKIRYTRRHVQIYEFQAFQWLRLCQTFDLPWSVGQEVPPLVLLGQCAELVHLLWKVPIVTGVGGGLKRCDRKKCYNTSNYTCISNEKEWKSNVEQQLVNNYYFCFFNCTHRVYCWSQSTNALHVFLLKFKWQITQKKFLQYLFCSYLSLATFLRCTKHT